MLYHVMLPLGAEVRAAVAQQVSLNAKMKILQEKVMILQ